MKPKLKALGTKRLTLKRDEPLSSFAFKFNLRRYNKAEVMNLIGEVDGKVAIILDDMIDTGGTLVAGAKLIKKMGAKEIYACATHAVFSPPAVERLGSGVFTEVIVTNSMPHTPERDFPQLTVLSVGNLLGETIWRVHNDTPVSFNKL